MDLSFLPCAAPPKMQMDETGYVPPDVFYFNRIYYSLNMTALLREIGKISNPDEDKITTALQEALMQPFKTFITIPDDSVIAADLQMLLRHKLVHDFKWFPNENACTSLMTGVEMSYMDNCCFCFSKRFNEARTHLGEAFDEMWMMAMERKNSPTLMDPNEKAAWIYKNMKNSFICTDLAASIQSQVNFHIDQITSFVINIVKSGEDVCSMYTMCCSHKSD